MIIIIPFNALNLTCNYSEERNEYSNTRGAKRHQKDDVSNEMRCHRREKAWNDNQNLLSK